MSRIVCSILAICFLLVSTLAQASSGVDHKKGPITAEIASIVDHETAVSPLDSDDCPCDAHNSKMASIVCGVTLAFDDQGVELMSPAAISISLEWISDTVPDTINSKLKRPPRLTL